MGGKAIRKESVRKAAAAPAGVRNRSTPPLQMALHGDPLISPYWWLIGPGMALAALLLALGEGAFPKAALILLLGVAAVLAGSAGFLARFEGDVRHPAARRFGVATALIAAPVGAFGAAIVLWASSGALSWHSALAALVGLGAFGSLIQASRRHMILLVHVPLWGAVTVAEGSLPGAVALLLMVPLAVFGSRRQVAIIRRRRQEAAAEARLLRLAQDLLWDFEDTRQGWFWETDRRGIVTYLSHPVAGTLERKLDDLVGRPFSGLFDMSARGDEGERTLAFHLSARTSFQELTVRAGTVDAGEERWWSISGRPVYDDFGNFAGFRGSGHDLTEKKKSQEEASRLAQYDSLTGLANRHNMLDTLDRLLTVPQPASRSCAILLLDLDRFKQVNDTLGHPAGDALLKQVAQRLQRVIGIEGKVGRLGGDEFKVILGTPDRGQLVELAENIIADLSQPYSIDGHSVVIGVSVGIAIAPEHGETSDELIRNADLALYAAKDAGRGRYHFFADDLHLQAEERRQLEQDLRDAIHNGGLELHYQPVIETATEEICGFEALLRWNHPVRGPLSPARFVDVAEDAGLISAIGEWALRTACHDLASWPENIRVAVNVSPLQFANPQLPAIVTNAIARAGIAASRLELEITESVFLNDDDGTDAMFAALKRVGVRLALDDFGTGYSSLGYLKKAPFDKIKIDQSFVRGATQPGSRNGAIIASITSLAQSLGMDTTAEGVETFDELELVRLYGCSHIQGFIYEAALSATAATERLRTGLKAVAQGPRCARVPRQKMLRKVVLDHQGQIYTGTVRNISSTGALVQGLWNVPPGTAFTIALSETHAASATCRWCEGDLIGLEFTAPLERDSHGNLAAMGQAGAGSAGQGAGLRMTG